MKKIVFSLLLLTATSLTFANMTLGQMFSSLIKPKQNPFERLQAIQSVKGIDVEHEEVKQIESDETTMTSEQRATAIETLRASIKSDEEKITTLMKNYFNKDRFQQIIINIEVSPIRGKINLNYQKLNELMLAQTFALKNNVPFFSDAANKNLISQLGTMITGTPEEKELAANTAGQEIAYLKAQVKLLQDTVKSLMKDHVVEAQQTLEKEKTKAPMTSNKSTKQVK